MEFKKYTVEELVQKNMLEKPLDGNHGNKHPKSSDYTEQGIPFIMVSNISNGRINYNTCKFISKKQRDNLDKGFSKAGDVLLSHKATIGLTCIVDNKYPEIVITPQLTYYRVKKDINNYYLKYYFDSPYFQKILKNWATSGSTRAYLGITAQLKLPILLPDLIIQNKIATILQAIDRKIEVNTHTNDNLANISQLIFDDFVKNNDNLKYCKINELTPKLEAGKRPNGGIGNIESGIPSIGAESIKGLGHFDYAKTKYVTKEYFNTMKKGIVKGYELLIYKDGGKPGYFMPNFSMFGEGFPFEECAINEHVFLLDFKNIRFNIFAYYYFNSTKIRHKLHVLGSKSAAIPGINQQDILNLEIPKLNENINNNILDVLEINTKKIIKNCRQNYILAQLRDILLPKLMNGEIDLDKIEI